MALTKAEKQAVKDEFAQFLMLGKKFANADVTTLYVVDAKPLLEAGEVVGALAGKLPRATWTRGKQGHGRKK
jgi:hypothetical protein